MELLATSAIALSMTLLALSILIVRTSNKIKYYKNTISNLNQLRKEYDENRLRMRCSIK